MEGILDTIGRFLQNIKAPVPDNQNIMTPQGKDLANYASDTSQSFGATPNIAPTPSKPSPTPTGPQIAAQPNATDVLAKRVGPIFAGGSPAVASPSVMPTKSPTPTITSTPDQLTSQIQNGFQKWGGSSVPAATLAASFARAGKGLPDPLMPAVLSLKETGGGKHMADRNNMLNIQYNGINNSPYEKPEYGIEGGGGHKGFPGVINNGLYNNYLKSGNLLDFFKVYTPWKDHNGNVINDPYPKQIADYNALRKNFTNQ